MTETCKTWSITGDKRITGLCSMQMPLETERIMRGGCPICVSPVPIAGPLGCFDCSADETFPAIWEFNEYFTVDTPVSSTATTSDSGAYSFLANTPPGSSGPATATITSFLPSGIETKPLIRGLNSSGGANCVWGNGAWEHQAWAHRPTYGSPSPSPGSCALTRGFLEQRVSYSGAGPYMLPDGSSLVGNVFNACYHDASTLYYANIPEYLFTPLPSLDSTFFPGFVDYGGCFFAPRLYGFAAPQICWSWYLYGVGRTMKLKLSLRGVYSVLVDPVVFISGDYWHGYHSVGLGESTLGACAAELGLPSFSGEALWEVEYPCGEPASVLLTSTSRGGLLAEGVTFLPETVTLVRT